MGNLPISISLYSFVPINIYSVIWKFSGYPRFGTLVGQSSCTYLGQYQVVLRMISMIQQQKVPMANSR